MCTINGKCGCNRVAGGLGELLLVGGWKAVVWLLQQAVRTITLALVLLILAGKWAAPRVYRLARRGYRAARHRWAVRPVVMNRRPAAELPQQPTAMTLADLRIKEPANR